MESLKAILSHIVSGEKGFSLAATPDKAIQFNGQTYTPDETKAFVLFEFSHAFPVVTAYGQALTAATIAKSFQSLRFQGLNYEHKIAAYDKENIPEDRILGTVLDVQFPPSQGGVYRMTDAANSPGITAIASLNKMAKGMDRVMGQHQAGRHQYTTSLECLFDYPDCAYAVQVKGKPLTNDTPADFAQAGWDIIPAANGTPELLATFSKKKKRIVADYKGRRVVQLMGGIDHPVHYSGAGLVHYGAEKEAQILRMAASAPNSDLISPLRKLAALLTS